MEGKNRNKFTLLFHPLPTPAGDIAIYSLSYSFLSLLIYRLSMKYNLKLMAMVEN